MLTLLERQGIGIGGAAHRHVTRRNGASTNAVRRDSKKTFMLPSWNFCKPLCSCHVVLSTDILRDDFCTIGDDFVVQRGRS